MAEVELAGITKSFGSFSAVKQVSLHFPEHTTTCLLGPSGCGKTTLLRIIAGLETPTSGTILIGGQDVTGWPARRRDIAMVFQYPVIYRGLSVFENIALPLREQRLSKSELTLRVEDAISLLGLERSLKMDPERFDNGTRQRVAFARAVARRSSIILFDEPITNVDPESKFRLKQDLKNITERVRQTIIYVTHDQNEAMTLADQIVLLKDGEVLQQDAPRRIYNHPKQRFGGWFLGSPGMSFLEHPFNSAEGGRVQSDLFPFAVRIAEPQSISTSSQTTLRLGIRPEHLRVLTSPSADTVQGTLIRKFRGVAGQYLVAIKLSKHLVWAKVRHEIGKSLGETVWLRCRPEAVTLFDEHDKALSSGLLKDSLKDSPEARPDDK
jgi:ABC-type sugar transport system ATPase subunit